MITARLTFLNRVISEYGAVAAEKRFAKQTELFRQRAKIERRQAHELAAAEKSTDWVQASVARLGLTTFPGMVVPFHGPEPSRGINLLFKARRVFKH